MAPGHSAEFLRSGLGFSSMSLPLRPEVQVLVHIRPVLNQLAHNFVPGPGCGLYARFYQAEPAPVAGELLFL